MKRKDPLKNMLQQYGTAVPSQQFAARLTNNVISHSRISYARRYRKEERLGKWIIGMLFASCLLVFIDLQLPVEAFEVILPVIALGSGLFLVIALLKQQGQLPVEPGNI